VNQSSFEPFRKSSRRLVRQLKNLLLARAQARSATTETNVRLIILRRPPAWCARIRRTPVRFMHNLCQARTVSTTKAVCRRCYIHPAVIDAYMDRSLVATLKARAETELRETISRLPAEEAAVLALLQQSMEQQMRANGKRRLSVVTKS
jgi:hypothetical protein